MKVRKLLITSLAVLGLVAFTASQAGAVTVGIQIEVLKNTGTGFVSQGIASGGANTIMNTPLVVTAAAGNTLRFVVMLNSDPAVNTGAFGTAITGDLNNSSGGSAELRYVAGSGVALGGFVFPTLPGTANPNLQLNDTTPANGNANSTSLAVNSQNLYRVDYVVQTPVTDGLQDFNVVLTGYTSSPTGDLLDPNLDSASVRVDAGQGGPVLPEPASILLLGSGLAALAGVKRRMR